MPGVALAARQRLDAGAHLLGDPRRREEPEAEHRRDELRVRRIGRDHPAFSGGTNSGIDEVPEEHLHQQRDVAEELDPGVAERGRARRRCVVRMRADHRAERRARSPRRRRTRRASTRGRRSAAPSTRSPPSGDLLEEDRPSSVGSLQAACSPCAGGHDCAARAPRDAAHQRPRRRAGTLTVAAGGTATTRRPPGVRRPCRSGWRRLP